MWDRIYGVTPKQGPFCIAEVLWECTATPWIKPETCCWWDTWEMQSFALTALILCSQVSPKGLCCNCRVQVLYLGDLLHLLSWWALALLSPLKRDTCVFSLGSQRSHTQWEVLVQEALHKAQGISPVWGERERNEYQTLSVYVHVYNKVTIQQKGVSTIFSHALWEISDLSAGSFILADFLGMQAI